MNGNLPPLSSGIGLRTRHYCDILAGKSKVDFFEVISENFMNTGGRPLEVLEKVRSQFPIILHGVSLNIGSPDPVSKNYLLKLKILMDRLEPEIVSDHLCWSGVHGRNWHDLLPLPMNAATVMRIAHKMTQVQDFLERRFVLENISTYLRFQSDDMDEGEFLKAVLEEADCDLLLDVNNIFVNAMNHDMDPYQCISQIPSHRIRQIHLAGHSDLGSFLFDTHDANIRNEVWDLFRYAIAVHGPRPVLIERDGNIPELHELEREAEAAKFIMKEMEDHHDDQQRAS